jgi:Flp pilus assembly protein TadG
MRRIRPHTPLTNEKGVTIALVAILMTVLVMFVALAVDLGHLYVARNELQNAADAGALAGAHELYVGSNATLVNEGANQIAHDAAIANQSEKLAVEVNWTDGNEGDVQRGHWSFANETFTPNSSLAPVDLVGVTTAELDANTDFINAVQVTARRQGTPVASFFAGIFGLDSFIMSAQATAYIGFAGTLQPGEVDQPIAICQESITTATGTYDCSIGRFINSGQDVTNNESGGWTSLDQNNPCTGGTNAQEVRSLVRCSGDSLAPSVTINEPIATTGGQVESAFQKLYDCWSSTKKDIEPWEMYLPVVECSGNNITTCQTLTGMVKIKVIWMNDNVNVNNPRVEDMPQRMAADGPDGQEIVWESSDAMDPTDPFSIWESFANTFNLHNVMGTGDELGPDPAPFQQKAIYFLPSCEKQEQKGLTGGRNFGILAKIPVLVD